MPQSSIPVSLSTRLAMVTASKGGELHRKQVHRSLQERVESRWSSEDRRCQQGIHQSSPLQVIMDIQTQMEAETVRMHACKAGQSSCGEKRKSTRSLPHYKSYRPRSKHLHFYIRLRIVYLHAISHYTKHKFSMLIVLKCLEGRRLFRVTPTWVLNVWHGNHSLNTLQVN